MNLKSLNLTARFIVCLVAMASCVSLWPLPTVFAAPKRIFQQDDSNAWSTSLETALPQSAVSGKPVFVKFDAPWCEACRLLEAEFEKPAFKSIASSVILVRIDVDQQSELAAEFDVRETPTLLLLDANGEVVARKTGFDEVDNWVEWLSDGIKGTKFEMPDVLESDDPPTRTETKDLIETLGSPDATLREITMERLVSFPGKTRTYVVDSLQEPGKLAQKIAVLEVLNRWQAPIDGLDPWTADTFTTARLDRLKQWKETPIEDLQKVMETMSPADFESAQRDIEYLLVANNVRAAMARLTRYGTQLLPTVYDQIKISVDDEQTTRLTALRYWLTASNELRLGWASGLIELASPHLDNRRNAAKALVKRATLLDQPLLLELFADSDPLVRELSLKGLQEIGAKETDETLARLLNDPDPNVRAAVLKQFTDAEAKQMTDEVAAYLKNETDGDLIVHALRFLRTAGNQKAAEAVLTFADHESWQVRAEVAESLGSFDADELSDDLIIKKGETVMKLLEDPDGFVVSRAIKSLPERKGKKLLQSLTDIAIRQPEIAPSIIESFVGQGQSYSYGTKNVSTAPYLRQLLTHDSAAVRADAIFGLATRESSDIKDEELVVLLKDKDKEVRVAALRAFYFSIQALRSFDEDVSQGFNADDVNVPESPTFIGSLLGGLFGSSKRSSRDSAGDSSGQSAPDRIEEAFRPVDNGLVPDDDNPVVAVPTELPPKNSPADNQAAAFPSIPVPTKLPPKNSRPPGAPATNSNASNTDASNPDQSKDEKPKLPKLAGERWLKEWLDGKIETDFPQSIEVVNQLAKSSIQWERAYALACTIALRDSSEDLDALISIADAEGGEYRELLNASLTWLPFEKRTKLFLKLMEGVKSEQEIGILLQAYTDIRNPAAATVIWELPNLPDIDPNIAFQALVSSYFGDSVSRYSTISDGEVDPELVTFVKQQLEPFSETNDAPTQKIVLLMMNQLDQKLAKKTALVWADSAESPEVKDLAFRILLKPDVSPDADPYSYNEKPEDRSHAVVFLETDDATKYKTTLRYLAYGEDSLNSSDLKDNEFYIASTNYYFSSGSSDGVKIRIAKPPKGMTVEMVSRDDLELDKKTDGLTTYFRSLFDDKTDLTPLIDLWHINKSGDELSKLVYQAVASTNRDDLIPEVDKIYEALGEYGDSEAAAIYWTIRVMDGKNAIRLRKKIRKEIGMSSLNNY